MQSVFHVSPTVRARESRYAPKTRIEPHTHPWAYLTFVLDGHVEEECDGRVDLRHPGDLRIMPAGVPHGNAYRADGARCLVIEIDGGATGVMSPNSPALAAPIRYEAGSPASTIARQIHAEFRMGDDLASFAVSGLLQHLMVVAARGLRHPSRERGSIPSWIATVRDRLHDEFPRTPSLEVLAREAGVHPSHLVRTFRRAFQRAPAEYALHLRIERGCQLLASTCEPISQIALTLGFSDQAHFTKRFRMVLGMTPGQYRRVCGGVSLTRTVPSK